jgi:ATP-dependent Clp protease ATP-binding subunit ClpA
MFERYTEKARRVIFYARYEASQYGSPYIETEHLLLGLLREDPALARRTLRSGKSIESIRKKIDEHATGGKKFPTSVDLPVSNESKRVMAYAAEEAERLANRHIGTEHLLLGLLRERGSFAAQLLNEEGVVAERARDNIAEWQRKHGIAQETEGTETVDIHEHPWRLGYSQAQLVSLSKYAWRKREWKPLDVLVESGTDGVFFDVSVQDDPQFQLVTAGWPRDWCLICNWELNADGGEEHSSGYTNGRQWLCVECYEKFFISRLS